VQLPALRIQRVDVHDAGTRVDEHTIRAAARIDRSANAWLIDGNAIVRRIEAIPYVAQAHIDHTGPGGLAIVVTERTPAACLRAGDQDVTIDATRRIVQAGCAGPALPHVDLGAAHIGAPGTVVADPDAATLLADEQTLAEADVAVVSIGRDRFGGLVARDPAGVVLRFGSDRDLGPKAALIGPVRAATRGRKLRAIDLRAPGTPIVEYL
jgi:hypothetical protein